MRTRVAEHRGISSRTGTQLSKIPNSNIYKHYLDSGHEIFSADFSVLFSTTPSLIKISESIAIHQNSPPLNDQVQSTPLNILS